MTERRPTNSELKLRQLEELEEEEREAAEAEGILELFDHPRAEDEPLARDADRQPND